VAFLAELIFQKAGAFIVPKKVRPFPFPVENCSDQP
jgi:hypothetical protein